MDAAERIKFYINTSCHSASHFYSSGHCYVFRSQNGYDWVGTTQTHGIIEKLEKFKGVEILCLLNVSNQIRRNFELFFV
jgi:hypothetical protein